MIILDLDSANGPQYFRTHSYFGQPFIYNDLFNFGGSYILYDKVASINKGVIAARKMPNSTMIGTGMTPEGLANDYIGADLMTEISWRDAPVNNLTAWSSEYVRRRQFVVALVINILS